MIGTAAQYYKATLSVTTGLSAPYNNLAIIYKQQVVSRSCQLCKDTAVSFMFNSTYIRGFFPSVFLFFFFVNVLSWEMYSKIIFPVA